MHCVLVLEEFSLARAGFKIFMNCLNYFLTHKFLFIRHWKGVFTTLFLRGDFYIVGHIFIYPSDFFV